MLGATRDDILNEPCLQARFEGGPTPRDLERAHPFSDALFRIAFTLGSFGVETGLKSKKAGRRSIRVLPTSLSAPVIVRFRGLMDR